PLEIRHIAARARRVEPSGAHQHIDVYPRSGDRLDGLFEKVRTVEEIALTARVRRWVRNVRRIGHRGNGTEGRGHDDERIRLRGAQTLQVSPHGLLIRLSRGPLESVARGVSIIIEARDDEIDRRPIGGMRSEAVAEIPEIRAGIPVTRAADA